MSSTPIFLNFSSTLGVLTKWCEGAAVAATTEKHNDDEDNDEKWATFQTPAATTRIQRLGEGKNQKNKLNHNLIVHDSNTDSSPGPGP